MIVCFWVMWFHWRIYLKFYSYHFLEGTHELNYLWLRCCSLPRDLFMIINFYQIRFDLQNFICGKKWNYFLEDFFREKNLDWNFFFFRLLIVRVYGYLFEDGCVYFVMPIKLCFMNCVVVCTSLEFIFIFIYYLCLI